MITLDLNHFGFCGRGGQRGGEDEEKKEAKVKRKEGILAPGPELDCENTLGTHKGNHKEGVLSQGQPKWWRAGRRTCSPG